MSSYGNIGIGTFSYTFANGGIMSGSGYNIGMGSEIYKFQKVNAQFLGYNNIGIGQAIFGLQNGDLKGGGNIGGNGLYTLVSGDMEGESNIGIGQNSYYVRNGDITSTAVNNIALGNSIYYLVNSSTSTFLGQNNIGIGNTLYNLILGNLTGLRNIGMGNDVFRLNSGNFSGSNNIGIGSNAMNASGGIAGNYNIALGYQNMRTGGKIAGTDNIAIGYSVLQPTTSTDIGSYNIGIGNYALYADMAKGNANIQIGNWYVGTPLAGQLNNVVAIGNEMNGLTYSNTDSNTILLGVRSSSPNSPKVGVGTYNPQAKLHVKGELMVETESGNCTSSNAGTIRFDGSNFYGCDGFTWKQLDN